MIDDDYEEEDGHTATACADPQEWAVYHCNGHDCHDPDEWCEHCGCCSCLSCEYARVA